MKIQKEFILMYSSVVGSYGLRTMLKSDSALAVDMIVKMPDSIFQEKDFLYYRYFYKRAYYLACIAAGLQKAVHEQFLLAFECLNGNSLHPILVVKPRPSEL
jgi:U3 small nucleolar RNA-associated protein 22